MQFLVALPVHCGILVPSEALKEPENTGGECWCWEVREETSWMGSRVVLSFCQVIDLQ